MYSNIGKCFREIRSERGLSLTDIASDIVSKSTLSKFERGESDLSAYKFLNILNNLGITFEEFEFRLKNFEIRSTDSFLSLIREAYSQGNENTLRLIKEEEHLKWIKEKKYYSKYNSIMVSILIDNLTNKVKTPKKDVEILCNYLFSIESWNYYEITLLGNSVSGIPINTAIVLSKELIHKTAGYSKIPAYPKLISQILINISIVCYENNKLLEGQYFLNSTQHFIKDIDFFEKTIFNFVKGIYTYLEDKKSGRDLINDSLNIFKIMENRTLYANYKNFFEEKVK